MNANQVCSFERSTINFFIATRYFAAYSASKVAAEKAAWEFSETNDLELVRSSVFFTLPLSFFNHIITTGDHSSIIVFRAVIA